MVAERCARQWRQPGHGISCWISIGGGAKLEASGKSDSPKVHRQSNLIQTGTKRPSVCVSVCVSACVSGLRICAAPRGLSDGLDGESKQAGEERRGEESFGLEK